MMRDWRDKLTFAVLLALSIFHIVGSIWLMKESLGF